MSQLIYKKMSDVMKEIGGIGKDQKNDAQGFKFRGIDQFVNALYPALTKHGVFMAPAATSEWHELKDVTRSNGKAGVDKHVHIQMKYTFWAEDGSNVVVGPIPAEGLDSGDKATNKALSAALKYALIQTFSIPTVDMEEADKTSPEIGTTAGKDVKVPGNSVTIQGNSGTLAVSTPTASVTNIDEKKKPTYSAPKATPAPVAAAPKTTGNNAPSW